LAVTLSRKNEVRRLMSHQLYTGRLATASCSSGAAPNVRYGFDGCCKTRRMRFWDRKSTFTVSPGLSSPSRYWSIGSMCLRRCRFRFRRWLRQWAQKGASGSVALCTIELAKGPSLYRSLI